MGLDYGPMHSIIPCLFVGLGVDDMFIIVQAMSNVEAKAKGGSVESAEIKDSLLPNQTFR